MDGADIRHVIAADLMNLVEHTVSPDMTLRNVVQIMAKCKEEGVPVVNKDTTQLRFHVWYPGCDMEEDAYGIPKPRDTPAFEPTLLLVPCVGYGPGGIRLGYGGGFYDRTLGTLEPRPYTVGLAYSNGIDPWNTGEPHDLPNDTILVEDGVAWQATRQRAKPTPADARR